MERTPGQEQVVGPELSYRWSSVSLRVAKVIFWQVFKIILTWWDRSQFVWME